MLILDLRMYVFIVLVTITAGTDYESIICPLEQTYQQSHLMEDLVKVLSQ